MARNLCDPAEYLSQAERCCNRCPAGTYIRSDCDQNKQTECVQCERGRYTATENSLRLCHKCSECSSSNKKRMVKECTAHEDTVCECMPGFFCSDDDCGHCSPVKRCLVGEGVKVKATRTNNTSCMPCEVGTYSNVFDFQSACQAHTRCDDLGKVLKLPGTPKSDAECGDFKSHCTWMLPAGLWSGLVLTALILLVILCCRARRRSRRAAITSVPVPLACVYQMESPLRSTEMNGHFQESCMVKECEAPLFHPESCCTSDSADNIKNLRNPLMTSVSISESNDINGKVGNGISNSLTIHSEPQEDEWCGT